MTGSSVAVAPKPNVDTGAENIARSDYSMIDEAPLMLVYAPIIEDSADLGLFWSFNNVVRRPCAYFIKANFCHDKALRPGELSLRDRPDKIYHVDLEKTIVPLESLVTSSGSLLALSGN